MHHFLHFLPLGSYPVKFFWYIHDKVQLTIVQAWYILIYYIPYIICLLFSFLYHLIMLYCSFFLYCLIWFHHCVFCFVLVKKEVKNLPKKMLPSSLCLSRTPVCGRRGWKSPKSQSRTTSKFICVQSKRPRKLVIICCNLQIYYSGVCIC